MPVLVGLCVAGYLVSAQLAARGAAAWLSPLAVGLLALAALLPALARGRAAALAVLAAVLAVLVLCLRAGAPRLPGYFVPPLLLGLAAWAFARTLGPRRRPLIARIVAALDGADIAARPDVARYARRLTRAWALLLGALALGALALALGVQPDGPLALLGIAPAAGPSPAQWSDWVNLGGYGGVGAAFAAEFLLRRRLLPGVPRRSFAEFARGVARLWPELTRR